MMISSQELVSMAAKARENAYAPYSGFAVGAALQGCSGRVYYGCNVENSAYSPSICAERVAIGSAIAAGERNFAALAVIGNEREYCYPCGVCRQVLAEFCDEDFPIYVAKGLKEIKTMTLGSLLAHAFRLK